MRFGGLTAVDSVNFRVNRGEIMGLIGPNGAGKTTFFNCLTGPVPAHHRAGGASTATVLPPKPRKVVKAGMARTFQNIRLFGNMTALENVMVGRYCRTTTGPLTSIIRGPKFRRDEKAVRERSQELLDFVGLGETTDDLARNLPYGDQRRLEIARALATDPKLLLLDEPTAGMNPQETRQAEELIFRIRDLGPRRRGDRARHAVHLQPVRPGALPGAGPDADRGHAGGGAVRPAGDRGLHRHRPGGRRRAGVRAGEGPTRMLEVKDLKVAYGRVRAVKGISFTVEQGQVVTLVGTNGAGKTTTLRTISGLLKPRVGRDLVRGQADRLPPRRTRW